MSLQQRRAADARRRAERSVPRRRSAARSTRARERGLVAGALTPGDLLRLPQALTIRERTDRSGRRRWRSSRRWSRTPSDAALDELDAMRDPKASYLRADLDARRTLARRPVRARRARRRRRGWTALQARLARARARAARRRAGRRGADRAGDRRSSSAGRTSARRSCGSAGISTHWRALADGAGAVRPQAGFPAAGDEPRGEHDGVEGGRACACRRSSSR